MASEHMRFHTVGQNILLSEDGTKARRRFLSCGALCFTNRPLKRGEELTLEISGPGSGAGIEHFTIGVTTSDPSTLGSDLPYNLMRGAKEGGFLASDRSIYEHCVRWGQKLLIYFNQRSGELMISSVLLSPRALFAAALVGEPVYIVMHFYGHSRKIRISSRCRVVAHEATKAPAELPQQEFVTSEQPRLQPAIFAYPLPLFDITVSPTEAKSRDPHLSRMNFAFVETPLRPNCALVVKLTKLKRGQPVQIVLTTQDVRFAYSYGYLSELCEHTYSLPIESDIPSDGDELAIKMSSGGAVFLSHNRRKWLQKIHVDPLLEYHVAFSMQHISVLTMVGMETDVEDPADSTKTALEADRERFSPECIICLEDARAVVLVPCFHFAFCEKCAYSLQQRDDARCPLCRETIIDVKKIYAV